MKPQPRFYTAPKHLEELKQMIRDLNVQAYLKAAELCLQLSIEGELCSDAWAIANFAREKAALQIFLYDGNHVMYHDFMEQAHIMIERF